MDSRNIASLFFDICSQKPDTIAIMEKDRSISYSELEKEVRLTVGYFESKGLKSGDRVLVFVPMSIDLYRIALALFSMGAVAVFLDEWVSLKRLRLCCKLADCKGIVAHKKIMFMGLFIKEIRRIPIRLQVNKKAQSSDAMLPIAIEENASALITFTTGSVGAPKAANRTHQFLDLQFQALMPLLLNGNQTEMPMLPIVLFLNLAVGKTSVLADFKFSKPHTFDAEKIWNQIRHHNIEGLVSSPSYLLNLAHHQLKTPQPHGLKTIISGGAAIFPSAAQTICTAMPHSDFIVVYGSTEVEPISHCSAHDLVANSNNLGVFAGQPHEWSKVKIVDFNANLQHQSSDALVEKATCGVDQPGEILVSGPHVLQSYLFNDEVLKENKIYTETTIWHRTGDAGKLNSTNGIFLLGRVNQVVHHLGSEIYPFDVEQRLSNLSPPVLGTVLLIGDKLTLIYENKGQISEPELLSLFKDLPISCVVKLKELPVDPRHRAKIDYGKLREKLNKESLKFDKV